MPFDGNGNWTSNYYPQSGELIKASDFNNTFIADIANGFGNCVTRDGQGVMQTNTNANNYRVINVADPINDKDAVNLQTANGKDALCVHLSGEETITGDKTISGDATFTGDVAISGDATFTGDVTFGTETAGGLAMPDWSRATIITLPYTTTENGYIVRNVYASSYIHLNIGNTGIKSFAGASSNNVSVYLPTPKGIEYTKDSSHGNWDIFFVPCVSDSD